MAKSKTKPNLNNVMDPSLLNKIDRLFACGVGDYVELPIIVVVGDQSSGKSSVLEGISSLPFPRDSGLCTRWATQITFRRSPVISFTASIISAKTADTEHKERVMRWRKRLPELDTDSFAEIMKEVQKVMGLGDQKTMGNKGTFSDDVLRLEISGPNEQHFSIVDVPGIFRTTTPGVTTEADKTMVRTMVSRYMENSRSIMLTVIPANVDIATQEILDMAKAADPDGYRTLGVLTKPDLVDAGAEEPIMDLVKGGRHPLNLGWCMVRNPGQKQLKDNSCDRMVIEEDFFRAHAPWNTLDKERVGVRALKQRLQEILTNNINREFPKVKTEIFKKLAMRKKELEGLGTKRDTPAEQRQYLLKMSSDFQNIAESALSANYHGNDCFDIQPVLRFATNVVNRNEVFAKMLDRYGKTYRFHNFAPKSKDTAEEGDNHDTEAEKGKADAPADGKSEKGSEGKKSVGVRFESNIDCLEDPPDYGSKVCEEATEGILEWLQGVYKSGKGFELGTFDSRLLATTMKYQTQKWKPIALGYTEDVITLAHQFISTSLGLVCPDTRVRDGLMSVLVEGLSVRYRQAIEHTQFLLSVERTGTPSTMNHYFNDNLEKSRQTRLKNSLERQSITDIQHGAVVRIEDIVKTQPKSNAEHAVQEIHDILKAYYKVACKRFTDNICMQAVDHYLVTGPKSALKLFCPTLVANLTDEQLMDIAGEDSGVRRRREALSKEIADLEAGKRVL